MQLKINFKRIITIIAIPALTFLVFWVMTRMQGISLIGSPGHIQTFVRSTTIIAFTSWALALNLNSGRFDFSLGSMAILSSIIATQITVTYDLPAFTLLISTIIVSAILGLISGLIYIMLKLQPIIISVGVMLMYEALTFIVTDGQGVLISTNFDLLVLSSTRNLIIIATIGFLLMFVIMNYTTYGYNYKALQHGQQISVNTGLQEVRNALMTYVFSGALMGVVGFINMTTQGFTSATINFGSISLMFVAFLPMFIGGYIGRFSEERFGILIGSLTMGIVTLGFVRLNVPQHTQSFINAILLMAFLTFLNNQGQFKKIVGTRRQIQKENG